MTELVLRSMYQPDNYRIVATFSLKRLTLDTFSPYGHAGLVLSSADARRLRDFLTQHLGEQAPKLPVDGQWVYLETDSRGGHSWEQFTTCDHARQFASKRTGFGHKYQAVACLHQVLVPVVTTTYEWKDVG